MARRRPILPLAVVLLPLTCIACTGPRMAGGEKDAGAPATGACVLDATFTHGMEGGLGVSDDSTTLEPAATYRRTRKYLQSTQAPKSCTRTLKACGDPTLDVGDVTTALAHPDVVAALAVTPRAIFGVDARAIDGQSWVLRKTMSGAAQGEIVVGFPCKGETGCQEPPTGVVALHTLLTDLDQQELAAPECTELRK